MQPRRVDCKVHPGSLRCPHTVYMLMAVWVWPSSDSGRQSRKCCRTSLEAQLLGEKATLQGGCRVAGRHWGDFYDPEVSRQALVPGPVPAPNPFTAGERSPHRLSCDLRREGKGGGIRTPRCDVVPTWESREPKGLSYRWEQREEATLQGEETHFTLSDKGSKGARMLFPGGGGAGGGRVPRCMVGQRAWMAGCWCTSASLGRGLDLPLSAAGCQSAPGFPVSIFCLDGEIVIFTLSRNQ